MYHATEVALREIAFCHSVNKTSGSMNDIAEEARIFPAAIFAMNSSESADLSFKLTCQRKRNNVRAISVTNVVLENNTGTPPTLFASTSAEMHEVNVPDTGLSAFTYHGVTPFRCYFTAIV
jgi:hypothetical protein